MLERAPVAPAGQQHVLFEQFWLEKGPFDLPEQGTDGKLPADTVKRRQALLLALFLLLNSCMASFAKLLFARTRCTWEVPALGSKAICVMPSLCSVVLPRFQHNRSAISSLSKGDSPQ